MRELIVDSFAGGGGTSEGIRQAVGRDPDIAINHDALALAMHRANHPNTKHMVEDVWHVDALGMCDGAPIGLLWLSPDCKHFSKAKGGKPRDKDIRGLAWVGLKWVNSLPKRQRPRIIILENVEEFQDWGPLLEDGRPCPVQRGATFKQFVGAFESMGYRVEWSERRACDYGDPTIRKRLFVIARRDKKPIVWPDATHANPKDDNAALMIANGGRKPWRTAAEIIDWTLPCPSIFDTTEAIKALYGVRAIRPLADNTMSRVAKGVKRYVIDAAQPFIVPVTHVDEPLRTITTAKRGEHALIAPHVMTMRNAQKPFNGADEPVHTITAGGASLNLVAPLLVGCGGRAAQSEPRPGDEPVLTQTAKADACIVSPFLVPRYGERPGQDARTRSIEEPAASIVPTGNEGSLAAVHLQRQFGASVGSPADEPAGTVTAGGAGKTAVVAAFIAQHNSERSGVKAGSEVREPLSTITTAGGHQNVVAAHLLNLRGSDRRDSAIDEPAPTVSAQGNHAATVYAFLSKYYGEGLPSQPVDEPIHTVTTKPRHGLVTVQVAGEPYVIVDIGMRMLTPRERFSAQGFRSDYIIDHGIKEDGSIVNFTLEQQGRMCGNSVCPGLARALVAANYVEEPVSYSIPTHEGTLLEAVA